MSRINWADETQAEYVDQVVHRAENLIRERAREQVYRHEMGALAIGMLAATNLWFFINYGDGVVFGLMVVCLRAMYGHLRAARTWERLAW
jgi:hypothetical protein